MAAYTTVDDAGSFYNTVLYVGNDGTGHAITGTGFQPDFTWIKNRDATDFHVLTDAVRGATKYLQANDSAATVTNAESLQSFDTDGFTVGNIAQINTSPEDYASWNWKMGTTSGLTGGTITPDGYSFSATAGQGVYEYTGGGSAGTISHGLGAIPTFMMVKRSENDAQEWRVYHQALGPTKNLVLDQVDAANTTSINWDDTAPTSSVFTVGSSLTESAKEMMAYVFVDVQGYSKFGTYVGNGDPDGAFIYTGFRPAWIMTKATSHTQNWGIFDNKRLGYNVNNEHLYADTTAIEQTPDAMDILSNGFKMREDRNITNGSGYTYVYAAFAECPLVNSNGAPCNAR